MIFRKILAIVDYLGALILLLLSFIGGHLLYPTMYLFRHSIDNTPVFWWWFDDEDGYYGAEYWQKAKKITVRVIEKTDSIWKKTIKEIINWLIAIRWSGMRNPMWNAHTKIKPPSGNEIIIKAYGNLTRNGEEIALSNSAGINYEDADGRYQGNAGDIFSEYFSVLGWAFIWFKKENSNRVYWRFSLAKRVYKRRWIQLQFGAFHRYIWKMKGAKNNS